MPPGHRSIDRRAHDDLVRTAVRVEHGQDPLSAAPIKHGTYTQKKLVEVPYEDTVRIPVKKKVAHPTVEQRIIKGKEFVPVRKYKEVEESFIEYQEKEVQKVREVWVKKEEPYTEIVKTPVRVTKTRKIPYTDYVEKEVEVAVNVPTHHMEVQRGYRDDKILKTKLMEVEEDIHVEMRPVVKSRGNVRVKDVSDEKHHGVTMRGRSVIDGRPVNGDRYSRPNSRPMSADQFSNGGGRPYSSNEPYHGPSYEPLAQSYRSYDDYYNPSSNKEFSVALNKGHGQALGIHVDSADGATLEVKRVGSGLLNDSNRGSDRQVREGDMIVSVNGVRGDARALRRMLNEPGHMQIGVQRSHGGRSGRARSYGR